MDQLSQQLEATMIEPIRDAAVTKLSGPKILQVRRFSSIPPEQRRFRTNVNMLSKVAGSVFVFPLLGRWWIHRQDQYGLSELRLTGSGGRGVHFEPLVLSTFIRTVGVIVYASAPSALDLRQMCKEYWDLLLSLRSASIDPSVAEAILFGMLVVLEITEPRVAAENFPKQVVETQAWAAGTAPFCIDLKLELFQGLDEGKTKMLAGGILLKTKEIVSKHERLLLGDIISFGSISSAPMGLNLR
jgi:telomere length regulation protein